MIGSGWSSLFGDFRVEQGQAANRTGDLDRLFAIPLDLPLLRPEVGRADGAVAVEVRRLGSAIDPQSVPGRLPETGRNRVVSGATLAKAD